MEYNVIYGWPHMRFMSYNKELSNKTLQNLLYFGILKTLAKSYVDISSSISCSTTTIFSSLKKTLVYIDIENRAIIKGGGNKHFTRSFHQAYKSYFRRVYAHLSILLCDEAVVQCIFRAKATSTSPCTMS